MNNPLDDAINSGAGHDVPKSRHRHDPLCEYRGTGDRFCLECESIARIRADEREQAEVRVIALKPERAITGGDYAYCDALKDAVAAIRGEASDE